MKVTLVVPCYNEEKNVLDFFNETKKAFADFKEDYEILFVNDGSKDETWQKLQEIYNGNKDCVSVISFSRNFGKEAAIYAGLRRAKGEYVSIIDADLQQRPELVIKMLEILDKNSEYDVVAAYQEERIEGKLMTGAKSLFYKLANKICDIEFYSGASDFRTFRRKVAEAIISLPEYYRFSKGIFSWIGFETYYMPYKAEERNAGETKWSFRKLVKYAIEGFVSYTTFPLKIATYIGAVASIASILYMIVVIVQKLCFSIDVPGYPTLVVLILFIGGVQLMILGIIGEYLARIYIQGKNRPVYIEKNYLEIK